MTYCDLCTSSNLETHVCHYGGSRRHCNICCRQLANMGIGRGLVQMDVDNDDE
jgi:hypothetical protein